MDNPDNIHVLLVEDSSSYAAVLRTHLKNYQRNTITCEWVETLAAATEWLSRQIPDVVLLDLTLPDSSGIDTVKAIVNLVDAIPIIVLTGSDDDELALQALAAGAQDYLYKQKFDADKISRAIRHAISRRHADSHNHLLIAALKAVRYGVAITNPSATIEWCNPAFEKITGFSNSEIVGSKPGTLLNLTSPDGDHRNLLEAWRTEVTGDGWHGEVGGTSRAKKTIYLDLTISPMCNRLGHVEHLIVTIEDIADRKRIERMKKEFVATVSHELRTPLTSIAGVLGMAMGGVLGEFSEKAKSMLGIAYKNSCRLTNLINDLLDMEKLLAGKVEFDIQPRSLAGLLQQAVEENQPYAQQFNVNLFLGTVNTAARVAVDEKRFIQVLTNLISNAVKFSFAQGEVLISVRALDGYWRIEVEDHGQGIPDAYRPYIFEKFSQADASTKRQQSGTGLGLAISKELVEQMHGKIGFQSSAQGTTFHIELPSA